MTTLAPPRLPAAHAQKASPNGAERLREMNVDQLIELAERLNGLPVPGVKMTERQFEDWALGRVDAEWVDGEVILMAPANTEHETLDEWVGRLLGEFVERRGLGSVLRNVFVRYPRRRRRRVPDLMFIATAHRGRIRPTLIDGPPDLIVEIVSPDSQNRDRRDKYLDYEAAGVREYWIIDPLSQTLEAFVLRGKRYEPIPPDGDRVSSLVLRGLYLREKWLFRRQRPKVSQVLKELGVRP